MTKALLVIDVQKAPFISERFQVYQPKETLDNIRLLIKNARNAGVEVIFFRHIDNRFPHLSENSEGVEFVEGIAPESDEKSYSKDVISCFGGTNVHEYLQSKGIDELVICGIQTDFCVDTSVKVGVDLGYKIIVASDAHTTFETKTISAKDIIAHYNKVLGVVFCKVMPSAEIKF